MKVMKLISLIWGSMIITTLLVACGSAGETAATASDGPAEYSEVPRITAEELKKRLDDGEDILVIDTRTSRRQYDLQHIPGAIRQSRSFDDVARDRAIVAYCN
jgi:major membrane immunogen (membrane-anchored lipoprotein)